jgi:hypothetical protein
MTTAAPTPAPDDLLSYDDIRSAMEDGDVLLFRGTYLTSRIIQAVSRGVYSHSAIAVWWGDRLMLCQAVDKGVEAVPMRVGLTGYEGAADLYKLRPAARATIDIAALVVEAKADLGLPYSHVDLLREGAHVLLGTSLPAEGAGPPGYLCSQYVAHCFRKAGLPLCDKRDLDTSPTDIATCPSLELIGTLAVRKPGAPGGRG